MLLERITDYLTSHTLEFKFPMSSDLDMSAGEGKTRLFSAKITLLIQHGREAAEAKVAAEAAAAAARKAERRAAWG